MIGAVHCLNRIVPISILQFQDLGCFNKTLNLPNWVNLGKVRVAYAKNFASANPYNIVNTYGTPNYFDTFGPQLTSPYLGVGAYGLTTITEKIQI